MRFVFLQIIIALTTLTCCEKDNGSRSADNYLMPVGRSSVASGSVKVTIGQNEIFPETICDSNGGYWFRFPAAAYPEEDKITITFVRRSEDRPLFCEGTGDPQAWLHASYYIDSENETIITTANTITKEFISNVEKARAIQQFVINHVKLKIYKDSFLEKASETFSAGYGTCINFSRLYVALCRAAGIPSRTIWGIIYGYDDDHIYDYHHQWAEIRDESGCWHPADFNYTRNFDLHDVRYLDLIYGAEENGVIKNLYKDAVAFDNVKYYNDYPVTLSARLGFNLTNDNRPDSMVVEYVF